MALPFIGEVQQLGFNWAPEGYSKCEGQDTPISQYQALYSLLGTQFGGDGRVLFKLPDLRGRVPVHPGNDIIQQGQVGGFEHVRLTQSNTGHTHPVRGLNVSGNAAAPLVPTTKTSNRIANERDKEPIYRQPSKLKPIAEGLISSAGGGQSHANMQPYQVICFVIAMDGLYPSRN